MIYKNYTASMFYSTKTFQVNEWLSHVTASIYKGFLAVVVYDTIQLLSPKTELSDPRL